MVSFNEEEQEQKIGELRRREEEDLARMLSEKYDLAYLDLSTVSINTDALRLVAEETARRAEVAAFQIVGKKLSLAIRTPNNPEVARVLEDLGAHGYIVTEYMVSSEGLERAWERYKDLSFASETKEGILDISGAQIQELVGKLVDIGAVKAEIESVLAMKKAYRISRILETVLAGALAVNASDVHVEPEESYVRLRYRLDGVLADVLTFDAETNALILSRIKLLSGMKLNVHDSAQDGRFSVKIGGSDIEVRTSVLPGAYGESVVLRVLDPATITHPIEEIGIEPALLAIVEREIRKPNGMILATGPTGSGKTTALYAFMRRIHTPQVKIITIEDPIEYHLPGIVQTQVDGKKYTFAGGLRSALRQDPDVIMVGEIRDAEVATTAVNAALTGHLVFSTLHTNTAAGAFPRLVDLGIDPKIVGSAVNIVMAQRLVRKLCTKCRREGTLGTDDRKVADAILAGVVRRELIPENTATVFSAVGCPACNNTGYRGRIGIFEAILIDDSIERVVKESPSEREIARAARPQGILSLAEDGIIKMFRGVTSMDELARVIDLAESAAGYGK